MQDFIEKAYHYLKAKEAFAKRPRSVALKDTTVEIVDEATFQKVDIQQKLHSPAALRIICEHSAQNKDFLLKNWDAFVAHKTTITFLYKDLAWSIRPTLINAVTPNVKKSVDSLYANAGLQ